MGKERRLEKKIKQLEEAASVGGAADELVSTVVAELIGSPMTAAEVASKANEKEKKPRKKRTKKTVEPGTEASHEPLTAAKIPPIETQTAVATVPAPVASTAPLVVPAYEAPIIVDRPQTTSSSDSTSTPPVMGETDASSKSAPETVEASEAVLEESPHASISLTNLSTPASVPKTLTQKVDMLSDAVLEFVTDQIVALRALRETVAALASEECQKACDAKMRKRPRPAAGVSTPKKRRVNGYQLFCQTKRLELTPAKQATTELGKMWKELTDEERARFKNEADKHNAANDSQHAEPILDGSHED